MPEWHQTPSLPDADPLSDCPRRGGRESKFLAAKFLAAGNSQDVGINKTSVTTGVWHHFAIVRGDTTLSL